MRLSICRTHSMCVMRSTQFQGLQIKKDKSILSFGTKDDIKFWCVPGVYFFYCYCKQPNAEKNDYLYSQE